MKKFEDERCSIKLYNQDCMSALEKMGENEFDLTIVDPPYGIPKVWGGAGKLKNRVIQKQTKKTEKWDVKPKQKYFDMIFKIGKNQIIFGANYFDLPPTRGIACWDKCQPWKNFSQIELIWTSFSKPAKLFKFDNRISGKIHSTQKPVKLYKWLLENYAEEGDTILDTHLGSMSIAIACWDMGFDLIGYEIDEDYYKKGIERIENHVNEYNKNKKQTENTKNVLKKFK